jgi:hypothetical protein
MSIYTSPDVRNLSVGTGYIEIDTGAGYRHVGNAPKFAFKLTRTTLDHFVPFNGMIVKDASSTIQLNADFDIDMEEITASNLALILLGDVTVTGGVTTIDIVAQNPPTAALRYTGTNEVGPKWKIDLHAVMFNANSEFDPLSAGKFNVITVSGVALAVNGSFGVFTLI